MAACKLAIKCCQGKIKIGRASMQMEIPGTLQIVGTSIDLTLMARDRGTKSIRRTGIFYGHLLLIRNRKLFEKMTSLLDQFLLVLFLL